MKLSIKEDVAETQSLLTLQKLIDDTTISNASYCL